jgi:hypothetical protein
MAGALTPNRVALSIDRLESRGLLKLRRRSGRSRLVEFAADHDAIAALLKSPFAYARYTPGNQSLTVPFLKRTSDSFIAVTPSEPHSAERLPQVSEAVQRTAG